MAEREELDSEKGLCVATFTAEDSWFYTCDRAHGHAGRHQAVEYDPTTDSFREAEWE